MYGPTHGWSFRVPPGWPIPPAGWTPSADWRPDPGWPAAPQGWQFWVPTQPVLPAQRSATIEDYWPTPRRTQAARGWLMVLFVTGLFGGWFVLMGAIGTALCWHVDPANYPTEAAFDAAWSAAWDDAVPFITGGVLAATLVLFGVLGQRAGYRGARFLLVLVPFWGYVVMCRVLWRWTDIKHWQNASTPELTHLPAGPIGLPHHQPVR